MCLCAYPGTVRGGGGAYMVPKPELELMLQNFFFSNKKCNIKLINREGKKSEWIL